MDRDRIKKTLDEIKSRVEELLILLAPPKETPNRSVDDMIYDDSETTRKAAEHRQHKGP